MKDISKEFFKSVFGHVSEEHVILHFTTITLDFIMFLNECDLTRLNDNDIL